MFKHLLHHELHLIHPLLHHLHALVIIHAGAIGPISLSKNQQGRRSENGTRN